MFLQQVFKDLDHLCIRLTPDAVPIAIKQIFQGTYLKTIRCPREACKSCVWIDFATEAFSMDHAKIVPSSPITTVRRSPKTRLGQSDIDWLQM